MRDILFRAKRSDNGEWIEGLPLYSSITSAKDTIDRLLVLKGEYYNIVLTDAETICQYTGLTDKNNRKIFEGDIIIEVDSGNIGIIKFGLYKFKHYGFYIEWMGNCGYRQDIYHWTSYRMIRVIGNIFDNPQLLCEAGQQANADVLMPAT